MPRGRSRRNFVIAPMRPKKPRQNRQNGQNRQNRQNRQNGQNRQNRQNRQNHYNLRNLNLYTPDSDSDSSVIFVNSSYVSPQTASARKKNLKRRAKRIRDRLDMPPKMRRLTNTYSQTEETFRCLQCNASKKNSSLETLYTNPDYTGNQQSIVVDLEDDNQSNIGQSNKNFSQQPESSDPLNNTVEKDNSKSSLVESPAILPPDVGSIEEIIQQEADEDDDNQLNQIYNPNPEDCDTASRNTTSTFPHLVGGNNLQNLRSRHNSQMDLSCSSLNSSIVSSGSIIGDGTHIDNIDLLDVIDLGDEIPVEFYYQTPTDTEEE